MINITVISKCHESSSTTLCIIPLSCRHRPWKNNLAMSLSCRHHTYKWQAKTDDCYAKMYPLQIQQWAYRSTTLILYVLGHISCSVPRPVGMPMSQCWCSTSDSTADMSQPADDTVTHVTPADSCSGSSTSPIAVSARLGSSSANAAILYCRSLTYVL